MARVTGVLWVLAAGLCVSLASAGMRTSSLTMGKATVTSSSSRSSSSSSSKSGRWPGGRPPQPSITRLVKEYAIPSGQAVMTTQVIHGEGVSGITETMQITQTKKKKKFVSTSTSQIGNAPPVTTVTSSTNDGGSRVKVTVGQGREKIKLKARPAIDLDVKALTMDFFKSGVSMEDKDFMVINDQIDKVTKTIDDVFKTFFAADEEFTKKKGDVKRNFADASNRFKDMGIKYPDFQFAY
ncbi:uncharacterized protein LOC122392471 [Amphibalanus amphitrite]|uniref:uncharacterized protein LOC122391477 n=1 Tax=Amphibalanus amphitrite TaxID=1232801 RepID=UPI001C915C21|nr:uncharacterized protein LOC122391477 [Amphibalanus amphitrite]XP_043243287.1 uncharacterized protein LOC122392471 [Amphibalanus amphitrite]